MLSFDRFLNLVYYCVVSRINDEKERKKFIRDLNQTPAHVMTKEDFKPVWWAGDDQAGAQGLALARAFGLDVDAAIAAASVG